MITHFLNKYKQAKIRAKEPLTFPKNTNINSHVVYQPEWNTALPPFLLLNAYYDLFLSHSIKISGSYTLHNSRTLKGNNHCQFDDTLTLTNLSKSVKTGHLLPLNASNNSKCARKDFQQEY